MSDIPRDKSFDSTWAFRAEGYRFIANRCRRYQSDSFRTRLMLRPVICAMGAEAAEMFYGHPGRFTRQRAMPQTALRLLQDKYSVQWLDGAAHDHRKAMFMAVMAPHAEAGRRRIEQLADAMQQQWRTRWARLPGGAHIVLHTELREILCRAVCRWAGIAISDAQAAQRTRELAAMIDAAGSVGPSNWRALLLRRRTERWARQVIAETRRQENGTAAANPLQAVAWHRNPDGDLLDLPVAAVELINILRPTVAVARWITFAAHALHAYPACHAALRHGDQALLRGFVQEVRRFYPFFPVIGGRVLQPFDWRGHHFTAGQWVLLDLYGTHRDERCWADPDTFRPERFADWDENAFSLIPQGAGDHSRGHRCPGEWITIALVERAVTMLVSEMQYEVPDQDLRIDLSRLPTLPASGFVIANVRWRT